MPNVPVTEFDDALVERVCCARSPRHVIVTYSGAATQALARSYRAFQRRVAERIPVEEHRPSVALTLNGCPNSSSVLLIGGMGPLSDASILHAVLSASGTQLGVTLLSFPPPRGSVGGVVRHLLGLRDAASLCPPDTPCFLLSNTAHVMLSVFRAAMAPLHVHDLVADAAKAASDTRLPTYVITTFVCWKAGLYERSLPGAIVADAALAAQLQETVSLAKAGDRVRGRRLLMDCLDAMLAGRPRRCALLVACTEFATLVRAPELERRYAGVRVIDTDAVFSRVISKQSGMQKTRHAVQRDARLDPSRLRTGRSTDTCPPG